MGSGLISARVACLNNRYAVITGGVTGSSCNNKVWLLDTKTNTFNPSNVTLPTTGAVAVASDGTGSAMFFDGATGAVVSMASEEAKTEDALHRRRRKKGPPSPPSPPSPPPSGPVEPAPVFDGKVRPEKDGSLSAFMIPPYKSNHASTIEVLPDGTLAAAWFSGVAEEANLCSIVFSTMTPGSGQWSKAITVSQKSGFSNQNPVLFYDNKTSTLFLFHSQAPAKSGESQATIQVLSSKNKGATWTQPKLLISEAGAFPRNRLIPGLDGTVIFPYYNASSHNKYKANYAIIGRSAVDHHLDQPKDWTATPFPESQDCVQPTVVRKTPGEPGLKAWFRDRRAESIYTADSADDGKSWTKPVKSPLPNPNVGIEAYALLTPGHVVMVFNNYSKETAGKNGRTPLTVAISIDGGKTWPHQRNIQEYDDGSNHAEGHLEYSYPTVLQTVDGKIHIMYTYDRKTIKYRQITEDWVINPTTSDGSLETKQTRCQSDMDCSLNGVCSAGKCACDSAWTGATCASFNFVPGNVSSGYRVMNDPKWGNLSSWGGGGWYDHKYQKYFMFVTELSGHCGMHTWTTNSQTIRASSDTPKGLYTREEVIFPVWSHEAVVTRAPTGEYVAFFSYNPKPGPKRPICTTCKDGSTDPACKKKFENINQGRRLLIEDTDPTYMSWTHDVRGNWSMPMMVLGPSVVKGMTPMDTNMAAVIKDDGSLIGMWRDHHPTGKSVPHLVTASDWKDPRTYKYSMADLLFGTQDEITKARRRKGGGGRNPGGLEDMFLWIDKRGHYHAVFHQMYKCDACTAHAASLDGKTWKYTGTAATATTHYADGTSVTFSHSERPHILFAEDGVTPVALTNGVKDDSTWLQNTDQSFTLLRPLKQ